MTDSAFPEAYSFFAYFEEENLRKTIQPHVDPARDSGRIASCSTVKSIFGNSISSKHNPHCLTFYRAPTASYRIDRKRTVTYFGWNDALLVILGCTNKHSDWDAGEQNLPMIEDLCDTHYKRLLANGFNMQDVYPISVTGEAPPETDPETSQLHHQHEYTTLRTV